MGKVRRRGKGRGQSARRGLAIGVHLGDEGGQAVELQLGAQVIDQATERCWP